LIVYTIKMIHLVGCWEEPINLKLTVFRTAEDLDKPTDVVAGIVTLLFIIMLKVTRIEIIAGKRPGHIKRNFHIYLVVLFKKKLR
jgi:hypothetical protein